MEELKNKFMATIILHALGDTIGFRNSKWEFFGVNEFIKTRKINFNLANELLYEFIALGGINSIDLKDWYVSDDTLLHMDVIESLIESKDLSQIKKNLIKKFIKTKNKYFDNRININREPGVTTMRYISEHEKGNDTFSYDPLSGGNGAAMRSLAIGLVYRNNIDELIKVCVELSKITHNSPIGFLGAINSAYFIALALQNINYHKWPYLLIELLESNKIKQYINKNQTETRDYVIFLNSWKKYVELRFDEQKKPALRRSSINLVWRIQFYYDNFVDTSIDITPGASGYLVNIMAYDALLDSENNWEKLVVYAMLHLGDSDTVGCVAAAWYGALYGFHNVPENNLKYIEFKDKLIDLSSKLFEIYK